MSESPILKELKRPSRQRVDTFRAAESTEAVEEDATPVNRTWGESQFISLSATLSLLEEVQDRVEFADEPKASDAWLAARLHATLRLTPREASRSGIWSYVALTGGRDYVEWRWSGDAPSNRFVGGVNKQAIARLWWAAELLRDGSDYSRLVPFFARQDFPNSMLQRTFARNRPLLKLLVDCLVARASVPGEPSGEEINDVADAVNIVSLPRVVGIQGTEKRDMNALRRWVLEAPDRWPDPPAGPDDQLDSGRTPELLKLVDDILKGQRIGETPNLVRRKARRARRSLTGAQEDTTPG